MGHLAFWLRIAALSLVLSQVQAGMALAQECSTVGQLYSIDGQVTVRATARGSAEYSISLSARTMRSGQARSAVRR